MDEDTSNEYSPIKKPYNYNGYEIKYTNDNSSLNIVIKNKNDFYCYEKNLKEYEIQQQFDINIKDICNLIDINQFDIKNNKNNVILILKNRKDRYIII